MMSEEKSTRQIIEELAAKIDRTHQRIAEEQKSQVTRITINKNTHRLRFTGETEDELTVIIEPHEKPND